MGTRYGTTATFAMIAAMHATNAKSEVPVVRLSFACCPLTSAKSAAAAPKLTHTHSSAAVRSDDAR